MSSRRYGRETNPVVRGKERDQKEELEERFARTEAFSKSSEEIEEIEDANLKKIKADEASGIGGLCGDCENLRYIKTRLGIRDRFWCARAEVCARLPGGVTEMGDEVIACPWYSPRRKPGEMNIYTMFMKALLINTSGYKPGDKEHDAKHGITYL